MTVNNIESYINKIEYCLNNIECLINNTKNMVAFNISVLVYPAKNLGTLVLSIFPFIVVGVEWPYPVGE